jgi:hypothetical protein
MKTWKILPLRLSNVIVTDAKNRSKTNEGIVQAVPTFTQERRQAAIHEEQERISPEGIMCMENNRRSLIF